MKKSNFRSLKIEKGRKDEEGGMEIPVSFNQIMAILNSKNQLIIKEICDHGLKTPHRAQVKVFQFSGYALLDNVVSSKVRQEMAEEFIKDNNKLLGRKPFYVTEVTFSGEYIEIKFEYAPPRILFSPKPKGKKKIIMSVNNMLFQI